MIKIVGKKIISGDLNLTRISFPIKAMVPRTALENSTMSCCMNPYFMKRACEATDPLERFKYVITNTISAFYYLSMFLKPVLILSFSSTPSSVKLSRVPTQTALRFTASRCATTPQLVTSWQWVPKIHTAITVATTSLPMRVSTQCNWSTRVTRSTNSPTVTRWTQHSTRKCTLGCSSALSDLRPWIQ